MKKLTWKKLWLDDLSGLWYASKVVPLGWEYIAEENSDGCWKPSVFYSSCSCEDSSRISPSDRSYKSLEACQRACENHLEKKCKQFRQWLSSNKK
jgi:hypothetical protein